MYYSPGIVMGTVQILPLGVAVARSAELPIVKRCHTIWA
jgi:hypothetical protein